MIKALRVVLIVWAAIVILFGLAFIFFPNQLGAMSGYEKATEAELFSMASLGISMIVSGAFVIVAARDPIRNILWVQFAIAWTILIVVVVASSIGRGLVTFSQEGMTLIGNAVFAVALLALYPYRAAKQ